MSQSVKIGSVTALGEVLPFALQRQTPPSLQTGPAIQRVGRQGVPTLVFDDFSKGYYPVSGVARWDQSKGRVYYNQGVMLHMPGLACLPFKSTAVAALAAVDVSGYRAANKRVHAIMSSLGSSAGGRFYAFVGPALYKDTSTTDATLIPPATADGISDNVRSVWHGRANATDYLIAGTDGTTNDTMGTANPTADTVSWTEIFTHPSTDATDAGWYFPQWDMNAIIHGGLMYGFPGGAATLPYTSSTASTIVYTETKDVANPNASIESFGPFFARTVTLAFGSSGYTNLSNMLADDGNYAEAALTGTTGSGIYLTDFALDQELPANLIPTGTTEKVQGYESAASANAFVSKIVLYTTPDPDANTYTAVGIPKTQTLSGSTEFDTTPDSTFEFGGTQDRHGGNLTLATLQRGDFGFKIEISNANSLQTLYLDYASITVSGIRPGTQVQFGKGCHGIGPNPASATQRLILAPSRAEAAAVTVEREPWLLNFAFDSEGNRLTCSPTKVAAGMAHTEDAFYHQGGAVLMGGSAPGPAEMAKIVDSQGVTRSLGFPQVNGSTAVRITSGMSANTAAMFWTCNADATDAQLWIFIDGSWNAYGALFSKTLGGAMSTIPLAYAERTMGTTNRNIYNFYPTSTTNTSYVRQFVPTDVLTDPFLTNTSQVKQDGPLYFQTLELDVMPEEALKAFTGMEVQSRRVDNNTSYGSVQWQVDTGGDHAFAAAEIDQTFDAAAETYTLRAFSSSNDPGVAYKTAIFRCTLGHQTGTSETPNALPTVFYISADWKPLQRLSVLLDTKGQVIGPVHLAKRLRDMAVAKNAFWFSGEGQDLAMKFDIERGGYNLTFKNTTQGKIQPTWDDVQKFEVYLQEVEGAIA